MRLPEASPLSRQVREVLEELIISHELPPGSKLTEMGLAEQLGVSRGPLREAIRVLEGRGWVEVRPNRGAHVRIPTPEEVLDFFAVFELLESEAARLAAINIDDTGLREVEKVFGEGLRAAEAHDFHEVDQANTAFHAAVRRQCGNQELVRLLADLEKRARWYFRAVALPRSRASWMEHEELLTALRAGDPELATATSRRHVSQTARAVTEADTAQTSTASTDPV